jgi:hypothetical protein
MVSRKEYISRDISNLITKYLICKKSNCKNFGKMKVNPDQWNMDTHKGYYCTKCEQRLELFLISLFNFTQKAIKE